MMHNRINNLRVQEIRIKRRGDAQAKKVRDLQLMRQKMQRERMEMEAKKQERLKALEEKRQKLAIEREKS